ncbi:hypothetical protein [Micromonospora sp. AKA38]|uniref:hypothetical protein n=1 Tax=Micromonospora sp. AKA38 TaxID=2733861 RepID=UPI0022CA4E0C|nr:hypothetical protein [Micromonospora sp. AKA38]GHJ17075.1 hypothetical protein TPA0908_50700 [Micromonospora sp. AKA38]
MAQRDGPAYRIMRAYPARGKLQRFTLDRSITLQCSGCGHASMSNSVVTVGGNWSKLLCSRCYGQKSHPSAQEMQKAARPARRDVPDSISPLPRDMTWLASLHRSIAEGGPLSPPERKLLERRTGEPTTVAALRFAELTVDTEARIAALSGNNGVAAERSRVRDVLASSCQRAALEFKDSYQRERETAAALTIVEPLPAALLRAVAPNEFEKALTRALRRRRLPPHALSLPDRDVFVWLNAHESSRNGSMPGTVRELSRLPDAEFIRKALADVQGHRRDVDLFHPAVAERWVACAEEILSPLKSARHALETDIRAAVTPARGKLLERLREVAEAYARASARCLEARLMVGAFHVRAARIWVGAPLRQLRAECLAEAVVLVGEADPVLGGLAADLCREHSAGCAHVDETPPCAGCVPELANVLRERRKAAPITDSPSPKKEVEPPKTKAAPKVDALFTCVPPTGASGTTVVAVETHDREDRPSGYGWATANGPQGQSVARPANALDSALGAACDAALRVTQVSRRVLLVMRHERAANLLRVTLAARQAYPPMDTPLSPLTGQHLDALVRLSHRVSVFHCACPTLHRGFVQAERLARHAVRDGEATDDVDVIPETPRGRSRLTGPGDDDAAASWLRTEGRELTWSVALRQAHLDGGWCPLPDDAQLGMSQARRLHLRIDHQVRGSSANLNCQTALRTRGDRWELAGIPWPAELPAGTIVAVTWPRGGDRVRISATPLTTSERIDGVHFAHRYDARVVTREHAPGAGRPGRVPDLNDMSWVMHTVRKLGYLTEDGEAILAEDALVHNCLRLGLPPRRARDIPRAVKRLIASGALRRVGGSVDVDGRPWYPPRSGNRRVTLLRYVPRVEPAPTPHEPPGHVGTRRRHKVAPHLRTLPPGAQASPEKEEEYLEMVRDARIVDRGGGLPRGKTLVSGHERDG